MRRSLLIMKCRGVVDTGAMAFSVLEMVIILGMGALGILAISSVADMTISHMKSVSSKETFEIAKQHLRRWTSCPQTLATMPGGPMSPCLNSDAAVQLRAKDNGELFGAATGLASIYRIHGMDKFVFTARCAQRLGEYNVFWQPHGTNGTPTPLFEVNQICL